MKSNEFLMELSPQTLASYKKKAGQQASELDKSAFDKDTPDDVAKKQIAKANKRFSGIVKATKKEFDKPKSVEEGQIYSGGNKEAGVHWYKPRHVPNQNELENVAEAELDEACWKGYHKEGNKKMFGKTYPNCVKNTNEEQELDEMDKSAPQPGRDGKVSHSTYGSRDKKGSDYFKGKEAPGKPVTAKQMEKDALNILKKQGVAEGSKVKTAKGYGDVVQGTDVKTVAKADLGKNKLNLPKGYGDVVQPEKLKTVAKAKGVAEEQLDEKCWDTHKQVGMKSKGGKMVPNCVPKESAIMKGLLK